MGNFLEQDLQRNHRPSLMHPNDDDDVCGSPGSLISHLEAICYVNHQQHPQRRPPPLFPRAGGQQPDLLLQLHSRHWGRQGEGGEWGEEGGGGGGRTSQRKAVLLANGRLGTGRGRSNRCVRNESCGGAVAA